MLGESCQDFQDVVRVNLTSDAEWGGKNFKKKFEQVLRKKDQRSEIQCIFQFTSLHVLNFYTFNLHQQFFTLFYFFPRVIKTEISIGPERPIGVCPKRIITIR